jgi:hypothetical protein
MRSRRVGLVAPQGITSARCRVTAARHLAARTHGRRQTDVSLPHEAGEHRGATEDGNSGRFRPGRTGGGGTP